MKNIAILVLTFISASLFGISEHAKELQARKEWRNPNFEIINKNTTPIWLALKSERVTIRDTKNLSGMVENIPVYKIAGGATLKADVFQYGRTFLYIWLVDPKSKSIESANYTFIFKPGKDILVSFDSVSGLYPQTGKYRGISNETKSGISLKNNVTQRDITMIPPAKIKKN